MIPDVNLLSEQVGTPATTTRIQGVYSSIDVLNPSMNTDKVVREASGKLVTQ